MNSHTFAKTLRKTMTDAEKRPWFHLRDRRLVNLKFRRQMPVGTYIADFVCLEGRVIVELDGGQHAEQADYDEKRTAWLNEQGFKVLRFWNNEVMENLAGVLEAIATECLPSPPAPLPQGERGEYAG
jgi:very-short-patch-repair endonuclease